MRVVLHIIVSFPLSIVLLFIAAGIADMTGIMHGWGFWHGPFFVVWPVCLGLAFGALFLVPWFRAGWQS